MRRRFLTFALVLFFAAEALPLVLLPAAWHCYCPVKSACCRMRVCPMDAGRHHGGAGLTSCGNDGRTDLVPSFLRQYAVVPELIATVASRGALDYPAPQPAPRVDAVAQAPEHPPRLSFLATA